MFFCNLSYIIYINFSIFYTFAPAFLLRVNIWLFWLYLFVFGTLKTHKNSF